MASGGEIDAPSASPRKSGRPKKPTEKICEAQKAASAEILVRTIKGPALVVRPNTPADESPPSVRPKAVNPPESTTTRAGIRTTDVCFFQATPQAHVIVSFADLPVCFIGLHTVSEEYRHRYTSAIRGDDAPSDTSCLLLDGLIKRLKLTGVV